MDMEEKKDTLPEAKPEGHDNYFTREALVWGWAGAMLMLFFLVFINALFNTDTTQLIAVFGCYQGFHNLALFKNQRRAFHLISAIAWLIICGLNCYLYIVRITV